MTSDILAPQCEDFYLEIQGDDRNALKYLSPNPKQMIKMIAKSPIKNANLIKIPIILFVGKNDKRVPPNQSFEFYNYLKYLKKEIYIKCLDDNHSLQKVKSTKLMLETTVAFFNSLIK